MAAFKHIDSPVNYEEVCQLLSYSLITSSEYEKHLDNGPWFINFYRDDRIDIFVDVAELVYITDPIVYKSYLSEYEQQLYKLTAPGLPHWSYNVWSIEGYMAWMIRSNIRGSIGESGIVVVRDDYSSWMILYPEQYDRSDRHIRRHVAKVVETCCEQQRLLIELASK